MRAECDRINTQESILSWTTLSSNIIWRALAEYSLTIFFSSFKPYMVLDTIAFKPPLSLCILLHISLGKLTSQPHLCWIQLDLLKYQRMHFALSELTGSVLIFKVLVLWCITNIIAILFHFLETWELSDEELLAFWQDVTVISTVV